MRQIAAALVPTLCLALTACGDRPAELATTSEPAAAAAPAPAPADGGAPPLTSAHRSPIGGGELPAGHPPIDGGGGMPPPAGAQAPGAGGVTWTVPTGWVEERPTSGMRRAQFRVPGAGGDAELVVFAFGQGQGGDILANAQRWAGQFRNAAGQPATGELQTRQQQVNGMRVTRVEVGGTYDGGMAMMGDARELTDYRLLGAIAEAPDGNWFFKLTGPRSTIEAQRAAFDAFVASLQPGGPRA